MKEGGRGKKYLVFPEHCGFHVFLNNLPPLPVSEDLLFILLLSRGSNFCLDGCEIKIVKEERENYEIVFSKNVTIFNKLKAEEIWSRVLWYALYI